MTTTLNTQNRNLASRRAESLAGLLDIPDSYYRRAEQRYHSFADHLHRDGSTVRECGPDVYSQGSFRFGTVIRPLLDGEEYDLDMAVELDRLSKSQLTQHELKTLIGGEVRSYAAAHAFKSDPEEKHRCWRLDYADEDLRFHMDIVPAVPEDPAVKAAIAAAVEAAEGCGGHAGHAVAITDDRHPHYRQATGDWPMSNPRGYARWFEGQMRVAAERKLRAEGRVLVTASVDEVPAWQWKTPLQRSVQLLKRHRDVMFRDRCELAPISMILTTLAARSYAGEADLYEALAGILDRMTTHVRQGTPRIPNPVNPGEDFADRWKRKPELEEAFFGWHAQAKADFARLAANLSAAELREHAQDQLRLNVDETVARNLANTIKPVAPAIITSAPGPWGRR